MAFQAICDQLPDCPGRSDLPVTEGPGGFAYIERALPEFVGPDVAVSGDIDRPSIMIISAAGAMGKSTLAREIAARKRAPIWDLAQAAAVSRFKKSYVLLDMPNNDRIPGRVPTIPQLGWRLCPLPQEPSL